MISKVIGPMFAGKSCHLLKHYFNRNLTAVVVKPVLFDRDGLTVTSRSLNATVPCRLLGAGIGHHFGNIHTIYVDEAQGFTLPELRYMSRLAPDVLFYGLDYWADGNETSIRQLETDYTEILTALCDCGQAATRTMLISGDEAINAQYRPVCQECWNV